MKLFYVYCVFCTGVGVGLVLGGTLVSGVNATKLSYLGLEVLTVDLLF